MHKKIWAHYELLIQIMSIYITLFFGVPVEAVLLSLRSHWREIDAGVEYAVKTAILIGLKWAAIILPIVAVLFFIWFLFYSDTVELTETSIKYYRWLGAKKAINLSNAGITRCVFIIGLWQHKGKYIYGRKIIIFNNKIELLETGLYYKICMALISILGEKKIRLVDEDLNLKEIDEYFEIDYNSLTYEQQLALIKYYCHFPQKKYKTGEEILKKLKQKPVKHVER